MQHYTIFISDLHLSKDKSKVTKLFSNFLEEIVPQADALYILGDLFQLWIGDDDKSLFNQQVIGALKKASSKTPIYLMPGNRDFLLGEIFAKESGCILISDPYEFSLYGKKTLLTHGDLLCDKSHKYHIFRKIIRIPYGIKIFLKLPLGIRLWFATNVQKWADKIKVAKTPEILAEQLHSSKNLLRKFNSEQLIHGHIHIAETEEFELGTDQVRRFSLGDWDKNGNMLIYYDNNDFQFKTIN